MTAMRMKSGFSRISRCRIAGSGGTESWAGVGAGWLAGVDGDSGEVDGYALRAAASVGRVR